MARSPKTQKNREGSPSLVDASFVDLETTEFSEDSNGIAKWQEE